MYEINDTQANYSTNKILNYLEGLVSKKKAKVITEDIKFGFKFFLNIGESQLKEKYNLTDTEAKRISSAIGLHIELEKFEAAPKERILNSNRLAEKLRNKIGNEEQEHMVALYLNSQNEVIEERTLFVGSSNRSIADPKFILHYALNNLATTIIIAHNHPSGNIYPSESDDNLTNKLNEACKLMDIQLLDHVIVGKNNYNDYYSYREMDKI